MSKNPYDVSHNHSDYVEKIRAKTARREQRTERLKSVAKSVGKLVGITDTDKQIPGKEQKVHPYVAKVRARTQSKNVEIAPPRTTPPNDYVAKKRKATKAYAFGNQRQKARIPYPTRS